MATVGCHVEWGQVIQGDVVYLCVVLQQKSDTVKVVSLSRHVNWGQAILDKGKKNPNNRKGTWGQNMAIQDVIPTSLLTSSLHFTLCGSRVRLAHSGLYAHTDL